MIYGVMIESAATSFLCSDIAGEYYQLYMLRESTFQKLIVSIHVQKSNENFRLLYLIIKRREIVYFSIPTLLHNSNHIQTNRQ